MRSELSEALERLSNAVTPDEIRKWKRRVAALENVTALRREAEARAEKNPDVKKASDDLRRARLALGRACWQRRKDERGELVYQIALRAHQVAYQTHAKIRRRVLRRELERAHARA